MTDERSRANQGLPAASLGIIFMQRLVLEMELPHALVQSAVTTICTSILESGASSQHVERRSRLFGTLADAPPTEQSAVRQTVKETSWIAVDTQLAEPQEACHLSHEEALIREFWPVCVREERPGPPAHSLMGCADLFWRHYPRALADAAC